MLPWPVEVLSAPKPDPSASALPRGKNNPRGRGSGRPGVRCTRTRGERQSREVGGGWMFRYVGRRTGSVLEVWSDSLALRQASTVWETQEWGEGLWGMSPRRTTRRRKRRRVKTLLWLSSWVRPGWKRSLEVSSVLSIFVSVFIFTCHTPSPLSLSPLVSIYSLSLSLCLSRLKRLAVELRKECLSYSSFHSATLDLNLSELSEELRLFFSWKTVTEDVRYITDLIISLQLSRMLSVFL